MSHIRNLFQQTYKILFVCSHQNAEEYDSEKNSKPLEDVAAL